MSQTTHQPSRPFYIGIDFHNIAEAQVKTDKVDAFILARLLRGDLNSTVHIPSKSTRQHKEAQRCFFFRYRPRSANTERAHASIVVG